MNINIFFIKIFNKYLLTNKNIYFSLIFYWIWVLFLFLQFLILSLIIKFINFIIFFRFDFLLMVYMDFLKIRIKFIKELNRLQTKEKTKWTFLKWFVMWVSLIYPKFLWLKFFFCLIRYLLYYIFYIINFLLKDNYYIKNYNFLYSCYLIYTLLYYIFNIIFYNLPYKLSLSYIQFRILFFLEELNKFVDSEDFELVLDPFDYWYTFYYKPYQIQLDLFSYKFFIFRYDIKERNKIINKVKNRWLDLVYSLFYKLNFTKELRICKRFVKFNFKFYNKIINKFKIRRLMKYIIYEISYEIYIFLWNIFYWLFHKLFKIFKLFMKLFYYFYWGIITFIVIIKWISYKIFNLFF